MVNDMIDAPKARGLVQIHSLSLVIIHALPSCKSGTAAEEAAVRLFSFSPGDHAIANRMIALQLDVIAIAQLEPLRCFPTLTKRLRSHRIDVRIRFIQFGSLWR
jgi:hypothetical protein